MGLTFDFIFLFQHYILYRDRRDDAKVSTSDLTPGEIEDGEEAPLLVEDSDEDRQIDGARTRR